MLENLSAAKIVSLVTSKEIKTTEVVDYYLSQIKKYNPKLNAIVSLKKEEQIKIEANNFKNSSDKIGLIPGMPLAIKDITDAKGFPTTFGLPEYKNNIASKNSILVERLINQGAIIIGKTNTPELAVGGHTMNKIFGSTANAYDTSKSAGGSSGGAATAVAASLVPFADGTDMMGSLRNPPAFSNLYGFRPTPGVIPEDRSDFKKNYPILQSAGCIAKTPNELALFLDAIAGKHGLDPISFDLTSSFRDKEFSDSEFLNLKIAWLGDMQGQYKFESGIIELCENKLQLLEKNSIKIEYLNPELDTEQLWECFTTLRSKIQYEDYSKMELISLENLSIPPRWEYDSGKKIKNQDFHKSMILRGDYTKIINSLFLRFDFLVLPAAQMFPFDKNLPFPKKLGTMEFDTYHRWLEVVILSSLFSLPTVTVPVGFSETGLPMGMQIIAKKGDDLNLIAFAKRYEELFRFSKFKPKNLD